MTRKETDKRKNNVSGCTLPKGYILWKITGTHGRVFSAYVSAKSHKDAIKVFKDTYDFLEPKILVVDVITVDTELVFDLSKMLILGDLNIIEEPFELKND